MRPRLWKVHRSQALIWVEKGSDRFYVLTPIDAEQLAARLTRQDRYVAKLKKALLELQDRP